MSTFSSKMASKKLVLRLKSVTEVEKSNPSSYLTD